MGITIEINTSNNVTRRCATTIYNTAHGALTNCISAFFQFFAQIFNDIFVCKFLLCCYIRIPTQAITIAIRCALQHNCQIGKNNHFYEMGITIEITISNSVTRKCATTIYNTAHGALTNCISAFLKFLAQIFNDIFVCKLLLCSFI